MSSGSSNPGIFFVGSDLPEHQKAAVSDGFAHSSLPRGDLLHRVLVGAPRLVVVDGDGHPERMLDDIRRARSVSQVPLIALTPAGSSSTEALNHGADSTVERPVNLEELELKVASLLRRTELSATDDVYDDGQLRLERNHRRAFARELEVRLTPTEFRLLEALVERPGVVRSHEELMAAVWGEATFRDRAELKLYVSYVRRKLADEAEIDPIQTIRGIGYRYRPPGDPTPN